MYNDNNVYFRTYLAMRRIAHLLVIFVLLLPLVAQARDFSVYEVRVLEAYLAYYGRPADPDGLAYWSDRLLDEGGNLNSIIDAFGDSQEYQQRLVILAIHN